MTRPTKEHLILSRALNNVVALGAVFTSAHAQGATFANADLRSSDVGNLSLRYANVSNAHLAPSTFYDVSGPVLGIPASYPSTYSLKYGYFFGKNCSLAFANLRYKNLRKLDLHQCDLTNADFTGADLTGSWMWTMEAENAKFTGANLTNVFFSDTHFRSADFTGANIEGFRLQTSSLFHATGEKMVGTPKDLMLRWTVQHGSWVDWCPDEGENVLKCPGQ